MEIDGNPLKDVVTHIVNGTFAESFCFVCLSQLNSFSENIYTEFCKGDKLYRVADILKDVFKIEVDETDNYNVCPDCVIAALCAYKFYLQSKQSHEVINYYVTQLQQNIEAFNYSEPTDSELVCITLPLYKPKTELLDLDLCAFAAQYNKDDDESDTNNQNGAYTNIDYLKQEYLDDSELIVVTEAEGDYYKMDEEGNVKVEYVQPKTKARSSVKKRLRKKRSPMAYLKCTECCIKYRFVSKLKDHMKMEHGIDLFICKLCKLTVQNQNDFYEHLSTHKNVYFCNDCGVVLKYRNNIINHVKKHLVRHESKVLTRVCEICGLMLPDEMALREHRNKKHEKKYICFYCGRSYKGEYSLEVHLRKHEQYVRGSETVKSEQGSAVLPTTASQPKEISHDVKLKCEQCKETFSSQATLKDHAKVHTEYRCEKCERGFVDARALMWHQRLHNNERPYICDICNRGFVTENRRNQHALCAHTAPTRRCPLCPALFHMRSMVNTHIRKVHLKPRQQRRARSAKYQEVFWRTEVVPIQELSVSVQNDLLEMQTEENS